MSSSASDSEHAATFAVSNRPLALLAVAAGAAAAFGLLATAVARRKTGTLDQKVHEQTAVSPGEPVRRAAEAGSPIGKWKTYVPAAAVTAAYVMSAELRDDHERSDRRSRVAGATAVVVSSLIAARLNHLFDELLPQPPAPPGRPVQHPVFPSGHAFGTTSVATAAAYVLTREKLGSPAFVFPLALLVPLVSSMARLVEEKHWISDIAGAWLAAIVVAAVPLAAYEFMRGDDVAAPGSERDLDLRDGQPR